MCRLALLAVVVCLASGAGCGSNTPRNQPGGKVAVLDLDEIAKRLGRDASMTESIRAKESALSSEINARAAALEKQIGEKRREFGQKPNEAQKKQLVTWEAQARQQVGQLRAKSSAKLSQHRLDVIRRFREEVKAAAQRITAKKGIDLLLTKNDTVVFSYQPVIDITDDVVAVMMGAGPSLSSAPATRSNGEIAQR